ncbi:MAG: acyl-CoA thioesterase [Armatimonadota bacterium]|nr:acyl-CoA thioesterase [Armatimonadota bacterium]
MESSRVTLTQVMNPEHANNLGNVHGGVLMRLIDEAGAMCAARHARRPTVTVAVDSLTFLEPVHLGDLVTFSACLTYVGRTSMEVEVTVEAEEIYTGRHRVTNRAYLVYVALGEDGRPVPVPRLVVESDEERRRWAAGKRRQEERLARRTSDSSPAGPPS